MSNNFSDYEEKINILRKGINYLIDNLNALIPKNYYECTIDRNVLGYKKTDYYDNRELIFRIYLDNLNKSQLLFQNYDYHNNCYSDREICDIQKLDFLLDSAIRSLEAEISKKIEEKLKFQEDNKIKLLANSFAKNILK